jgi:hypothetical protein
LGNFCTPQHAPLLDAGSCDAQKRRAITTPVFNQAMHRLKSTTA